MSPFEMGYELAGIGECDACHDDPAPLFAVSPDDEGSWWICDGCAFGLGIAS